MNFLYRILPVRMGAALKMAPMRFWMWWFVARHELHDKLGIDLERKAAKSNPEKAWLDRHVGYVGPSLYRASQFPDVIQKMLKESETKVFTFPVEPLADRLRAEVFKRSGRPAWKVDAFWDVERIRDDTIAVREFLSVVEYLPEAFRAKDSAYKLAIFRPDAVFGKALVNDEEVDLNASRYSDVDAFVSNVCDEIMRARWIAVSPSQQRPDVE